MINVNDKLMSVVLPSVVTPGVVMPSVIMVNVAAPFFFLERENYFEAEASFQSKQEF
jgi:hypothetical protein